jgi:DnaJ-class molecular chaperone
MSGAQTQAEAKSRFREQAMKMHPDRGGSTADMQSLNAQWAAARKHPDFSSMKEAWWMGKAAALQHFGL